jgi:hypothetical protein
MSGSLFEKPPAAFTNIGEITSEDAGRRVRITGYVVNTQDKQLFILSDDTGQITVLSEDPLQLESFVRIIGSVVVTGEGLPMIRAEFFQDLSKLDKDLFKRTMKIMEVNSSGRKS